MIDTQAVELEKNDAKITYQQYGKKAAQNANANPDHLPDCLDVLYAQIVEEARLDETGRMNKIETLRKEVEELEKQKNSFLSRQAGAEDEVVHYQKQIEDIENNRGQADLLPFVIGAFITVLLTFFLWSFYAASGYAALNGVKPGTQGFAGVFSALSTVFNKGGFLAIITVLFPAIFLAVGFLIHPFLEKKNFVAIVGLLLFTFCLDAVIGYKVSENIHNNAFNAGLTNEQWKFDMIFYDLNFYLILSAGFVSYVMWGFLLNYTLNKYREIQPDSRIAGLRKKIREAKGSIQEMQAAVKSGDVAIIKKEKNLNNYVEGKVVIDITNLKSYIGQFMGGWNAYTNLMKTDAEALITRANIKKDEWLNKKIQSLTADN